MAHMRLKPKTLQPQTPKSEDMSAVSIRDNGNCIRVLPCSYYATIAGYGVHLMYSIHLGTKVPVWGLEVEGIGV